MIKQIIIPATILLIGCAGQQVEDNLRKMHYTTVAIDAVQTNNIQHIDNVYEKHAPIGDNPSTETVIIYFGAFGLGTDYFIQEYIKDHELRNILYATSILIRSYFIYKNNPDLHMSDNINFYFSFNIQF